ncbi:hypothetical protein F5Y16DRAFT_401064 [Xylariaceae sp. FL0255]|nr:hypothetical protein F5Y16DRAFT_401064 [Xylariaceae sp. FL0255]
MTRLTADLASADGREQPNQPYIVHDELAPGLTHYRFHRYSGWDTYYPEGTGEHSIFMLMKDMAVYSVVVATDAMTTVFGPRRGTDKIANLAKQVKGPAVVLNGGFFVHEAGRFRQDFNKGMLPDEYVGCTVGKTTSSPNWIDCPESYSDELKFRPMTDGTGFTAGPSLKNELKLGRPSWKRLNTTEGRFGYFACDEHGNRVPGNGKDHVVQKERKEWDVRMRKMQEDAQQPEAPESVKSLFQGEQARLIEMGRPPVSRLGRATKWAETTAHSGAIKTVWALVPGNLSHVGEPNNRASLADHSDGSWSCHAYTGHRNETGLQISELSKIMKAFLLLIGRDPSAVGEDSMFAIDGGQSVCQIYVDTDGEQRRLAQGVGFEDNYPWPIPDDAPTRPVPHAVVLGTIQQPFTITQELTVSQPVASTDMI